MESNRRGLGPVFSAQHRADNKIGLQALSALSPLLLSGLTGLAVGIVVALILTFYGRSTGAKGTTTTSGRSYAAEGRWAAGQASGVAARRAAPTPAHVEVGFARL